MFQCARVTVYRCLLAPLPLQPKPGASSTYLISKGSVSHCRGAKQKCCFPATGLSSSKKARRCMSSVAASLSPTSPEEDLASGSSEGLGSKIDLKLPRRRLQLSFTCDACGARSQRLINPDAYARGTVFVQCAGCEVYHKLVDNLGLIEEYDFRQETNNKADGADLNQLE